MIPQTSPSLHPRLRHGPIAGYLLIGGLVASCVPADPSLDRVASTADEIQGGQLETGYPAVGEVVTPNNAACTGVLVAPRWVLTAKHCRTLSKFRTGTSDANFVDHPLANRFDHPSPTVDLSLVQLFDPITDIDPLPFNENPVPAIGQICLAIGFGLHDDSSGTKRSATAEVTAASAADLVVQRVSGIGDHGDSGGPLLCNGRIVAALHGYINELPENTAPSHLFARYVPLDTAWIRDVTKASPLDDDPVISSVSWAANRLDLFKRGETGAVYHKRWDGLSWNPSNLGWESLGGATVGTPEVVSWGANRLDVFVRDTTLAIAHKWWDGAGWSPSNAGYEFLGAPPGVTFPSHPSAVSWGVNRLDVFAVGSDGVLYHKSFNGAGWSPSNTGWEALGNGASSGGLLGPIKAVSWGVDRIDVFAIGGNRSLQHKWFTPAGWAPSAVGWESLGGSIDGVPSVVSWASNRLDVFAKSRPDGSLLHKSFDHGAWSPSSTTFENLGGPILGSPRAVTWGINRLDVFVAQGDDALHHKGFNGAGWSPSNTTFENLGGFQVGAPSPVTWGVNRLDVFTERTDTGVNHIDFVAAGWSGFESLGVAQ